MKNYISTTEAARILGISTVAVFKKIKKGIIPAQKMGRNYMIDPDKLGLKSDTVSEQMRGEIRKAVKKVISEYGEALKKLGSE